MSVHGAQFDLEQTDTCAWYSMLFLSRDKSAAEIALVAEHYPVNIDISTLTCLHPCPGLFDTP